MSTITITRPIGKHNTHVIILDHGQDARLWDWTLLNAIKAEDDKHHTLIHTYKKGTYKGTSLSQIKISQQANTRCVALLQSSLSVDAMHLIMDLHDASTMRKRLLDVYGNENLGGGEEKTVLLLLQLQQGKLSLLEYLQEMKRRIEVCKRFGIHLGKGEQIQAIIWGLYSTHDDSRKDYMTKKLTNERLEADNGNQDDEIRCIKQIFDREWSSIHG